MARITVEDCLEKENNRFALVQLAAKRTKQLLGGAKALTNSSNKAVVTALREIADDKVRFMTEEELQLAREREAQESQAAIEQPILAAPSPNIEQLLAASGSDDSDEDDDEIEELSDDDDDDADDDEGADKDSDKKAGESDEDAPVVDSDRNGSHE